MSKQREYNIRNSTPIVKIQRGTAVFSAEEIYRANTMYWEEGYGVRPIAKKLGRGETAVERHLTASREEWNVRKEKA